MPKLLDPTLVEYAFVRKVELWREVFEETLPDGTVEHRFGWRWAIDVELLDAERKVVGECRIGDVLIPASEQDPDVLTVIQAVANNVPKLVKAIVAVKEERAGYVLSLPPIQVKLLVG